MYFVAKCYVQLQMELPSSLDCVHSFPFLHMPKTYAGPTVSFKQSTSQFSEVQSPGGVKTKGLLTAHYRGHAAPTAQHGVDCLAAPIKSS